MCAWVSRSAAICCVAIGVAACSHRSVPADPWDPQAAAAYLDHRIEWWMGWSGAARDQGTFCFSCHTAGPYPLSRPSLPPAPSEAAPSAPAQQLIEGRSKPTPPASPPPPLFHTPADSALETTQS